MAQLGQDQLSYSQVFLSLEKTLEGMQGKQRPTQSSLSGVVTREGEHQPEHWSDGRNTMTGGMVASLKCALGIKEQERKRSNPYGGGKEGGKNDKCSLGMVEQKPK